MTASEVSDIVAIAEMTPGPLGLNCATFAGMRTAGIAGAVAANLGALAPTLTVTTVLNVIYGLRVFDMVYALTNGGPGYATEVLYTGIYKEFGYGKYAMGTTLSSIMFVFMAIIGFFLIRAMNRNEVEE